MIPYPSIARSRCPRGRGHDGNGQRRPDRDDRRRRYQGSTLAQSKKSHVGAIGVMQIMPATGIELKVGDIRVT
jgi:hypothetical protein